MNIILLGGNNVGNRKWIRAVEKLLKPRFETHVLDYKHWNNGNEWINPEEELKRLAQLGEKLKNYTIFARSAGTMITLMGNARKWLKPASCVFVGMSIKWSAYFDPDYDTWLRNFTTKSLGIQKTNDPAISCNSLRTFLNSRNFRNYQLKEIPGDDHYYGNIQDLANLTIDFSLKKVVREKIATSNNYRKTSVQHTNFVSLI